MSERPYPPDWYVVALQDRIHPISGRLLAAVPIRTDREERLRALGFDDVSDEQRRANLAANVVPIQERKR
jgi:hypothetical protein